jgi:hypothetical protein
LEALVSEADMRIRFETTIDDVVAFNRYHLAHSPAWRRQVWKQMLTVPAILACLFLFAWYNNERVGDMPPDQVPTLYWSLGIAFVVLSVIWAGFIRWYLSWSVARNTRRFLAEGANRVSFGWREMELANNRLIVETELTHMSLDLRAVEKIVGDDQYTFVYTGASQAYYIPMNLYPEEEYRQFVAELREAWDNREAPLPPEARPVDARIAEKPL